jgi:DnaJ-class molecular chaperone
MSNYYDILGVSKEATEAEIKKSYRTLSMKHHPDRGGDKTKFQELSTAYETLSDPTKRSQYENELNGVPQGMRFEGGGMHEFHDIGNIFNMMFGMQGGMHGMPGMPGMHHSFGGGGPEIKIFHNGVPMAGHFFQQFNKPPPIIKNITINIEQSYHGVTLPIELEKWVIKDNNKVNELETFYLTVPPGIDNNEIIIVRDRGHVLNEDIRGDLKFIINVENNSCFIRQGLDIIFKKTISLKEALCGFTFNLKHFNGQNISLNNNTNITIIKPNYKKLIPNLGFIRDNNTGIMIIDFDVEFPDTLTEEQIKSLTDIL